MVGNSETKKAKMKSHIEPTAQACGCHGRQPMFWHTRNCRAALNRLVAEDGTTIALQTAIVHIMRCLDDMEALNHASGRCNSCGVMVHNEGSLFLFGTRFCMDCGTAQIEAESEDEGLRPGLAEDIALQALPGNRLLGLSSCTEPDGIFKSHWQRICAAVPEVLERWRYHHNRRTR